MTGVQARVDRVLSDGPFREIGAPQVAALAPDGESVVVAGELDWPFWHGRSMSSRAGRYPLAVFRTSDLACLHRITTRERARAIAFHPDLPLVAVGTTGYDGGWNRLGELLLLDLRTGATVSVLSESRQVQRIEWRDGQTLDLVLGVPCDGSAERLGTGSVECTVHRDDWSRAAEGMLRLPYREWPAPDEPAPDPAPAGALVDELCRRHGRRWSLRRAVWAVEALPDGRILAAAEHVAAECWSPAGDPLWTVPSPDTGYQLVVRPSGRTVLALTHSGIRAYRPDPSVVAEIDLADGTVRAVHEPGFSATVVSRSDGWWAARDASTGDPRGDGRAVVHDPDGTPSAVASLGQYWLYTHAFTIRYAPDLLFLRGLPPNFTPGQPGYGPEVQPWVVAVDEDGTVRRKFPLGWGEQRLHGDGGAYLEDGLGAALVHTGVLHEPGARSGDSVVVRRCYVSGAVRWVFRTPHRTTALDVDSRNGLVYLTLVNGELVTLDAADGAVRARSVLAVGGHRVLPLALARLASGQVAVGAADGRILVCRPDHAC